jgi:hypothetical protein
MKVTKISQIVNIINILSINIFMDYLNELSLLFMIFVMLYLYYVFVSCGQSKKIIEKLDENAGRYCSSCEDRSFGQCLQCYNCGFCGSGNKGMCMKGTFAGIQDDPNKQCPGKWYTNDTYWRNNNTNPDEFKSDMPFHTDNSYNSCYRDNSSQIIEQL